MKPLLTVFVLLASCSSAPATLAVASTTSLIDPAVQREIDHVRYQVNELEKRMAFVEAAVDPGPVQPQPICLTREEAEALRVAVEQAKGTAEKAKVKLDAAPDLVKDE